MNIKRKIIAAVVGLTLVALVAPGVAQGVTIEELLAQIAQLQAQLVALQGGTTPVSGTVPAACAGVTFTRALTVGSTGADVKCLQALLNAQGFTVATTGAGSPGSETTYFGNLTLTAVRAYQASKGWTPANQVGPLTRGALNTYLTSGVPGTTPTTPTTPGITTPGVEGSIIVTASASPASGVEVYTGQSNVAVAGVDVKATNSDVLVNRVDVNFTGSTGTSCNVRPWLNISEITVSDGTTSKSVAVTQSNTIENTIGSSYTVRVEGLGMLISKDTTKKLTVSVTGVSSLPVGATSCAVAMNFPQNAVRATDGAGVSQYGNTSGAVGSRTFTVTTGSTATLEVSVNADNPKVRNVMVEEAATTQNVELMRINVKAKNNDVILREVRVEATASDTLASVMPVIRLYDGSTELASTSTAATSTFGDLNVRVSKDTTKTLVVKGDFARQDTTFSEGTWVQGTLANASDIMGEDASTYATVYGSGSSVTAQRAYLFTSGPTFALVSKSIAAVTPTSASTVQSANATLTFNVTANGGDVHIAKYSSTAASSGIFASTTDTGASATVTYNFTSNAYEDTNSWRISNGETKTFTVTGVVANTNTYAAGYFAGMGVANVKWSKTDANSTDPTYVQTWSVDDLKTDQIFLNLVD